MERESETSALVAILVSLGAHAALVLVCAEVYARTTHVYVAGHTAEDVYGVDTIVIDRSGDLGERTGKGEATNRAPGTVEQIARRAPTNQTFLSRDPAGPGRVGNLPSMSVEPLGKSAESALEQEARVTRPAASAPPQEPDLPGFLGAAAMRKETTQPKPNLERLRDQIAAREQQATQERQRATVALAQPGASTPPADPAPMSDSESDPFSKTGGVEFRNGKMDVRVGREFKSVRPRLSTAAQLDLLSIKSPRIVLKIAIDEVGKVTKVDVLRSTGSKIIDQPVTVALYQWWFEPAKNGDGQPISDELIFPISWQ